MSSFFYTRTSEASIFPSVLVYAVVRAISSFFGSQFSLWYSEGHFCPIHTTFSTLRLFCKKLLQYCKSCVHGYSAAYTSLLKRLAQYLPLAAVTAVFKRLSLISLSWFIPLMHSKRVRSISFSFYLWTDNHIVCAYWTNSSTPQVPYRLSKLRHWGPINRLILKLTRNPTVLVIRFFSVFSFRVHSEIRTHLLTRERTIITNETSICSGHENI